ncbi:MAG: hypothetical protein ACRD5W_01810 [Candidatus Acidiferrales bacterium]
MFIAALILVLSLAALGQFAVFYWRALLMSTAADPISGSVQNHAGCPGQEFGAEHFHALLDLRELCPDLNEAREHWRGVRVYYGLLGLLRRAPIAAVSQWAGSEQAVCSRYAAVLIDRRLRASAEYRLSLNPR